VFNYSVGYLLTRPIDVLLGVIIYLVLYYRKVFLHKVTRSSMVNKRYVLGL